MTIKLYFVQWYSVFLLKCKVNKMYEKLYIVATDAAAETIKIIM